MISKQQIQQLKDKIGGQEREMLSLYAHVNPAHQNNHPKAVTLRARETLKKLGMPRELIDAVLAHLANETKDARTVAIFAGADHFEVLEVAVDLPVVDPTTGHVEARWGTPYLSPLLLALDEHERYGAVFIDRERWRFFEIFLGEIEELAQIYHPLSDQELERLNEARMLAPDLANARDELHKDRNVRHLLAWTHRFYKDVASRLEKIANGRSIDRLVLLGPDKDVHFLETLLPKSLRTKIVGRLHSLPTPEASPHEVLKRVLPVIEQVEVEKELELIRQIRERGVWGIDATLKMLQKGQVYAIAAPWGDGETVFVDRETGYAARHPSTVISTLGPTTQVQERRLGDIITDLASSYAARLELVRGKARDLLVRELGGLGGLKRW
jgi:peptide subunit release factor 1 (eRF1)